MFNDKVLSNQRSYVSLHQSKHISAANKSGLGLSLTDYDFVSNLKLKVFFQPPHTNSLSLCLTGPESGYVGLESEGLKYFEIMNDDTVRITSIKESTQF